ncbi:MAG: DEAD/DEAH box helicase [Candidatus Sericytochromatia bacterium]|nr:DEAD/DEAH box helicase [Candidatus Sericytochromatia bacterium]
MLTLQLSLTDELLWGLWAESGDTPAVKGRLQPSPGFVPRDRLDGWLHELGIDLGHDPADPPTAMLSLPHAERRLLTSGGETLAPRRLDQAVLRERAVPVRLFDTPALLALLERLPATPPPVIRYGDSLTAARRLCILALRVLAQGQYHPDLVTGVQDVAFADWRPVLAAPGLTEAWHAWLSRMPLVLLAGITVDQMQDLATGGLLNVLVDQLARTWLSAHRWPTLDTAAATSPGGRWLTALSQPESAIGLTAATQATLNQSLGGWLGHVREPDAATLCLQLVEPVPDDAEGTWILSYWLQSTRDPSLLIPAEEVWAGGEDWLQTLKLQAARGPLLTDLARAATVVPAIRRTLDEIDPQHARLSTAEAGDFLLHAAPRLLEMGIALRVPIWWQTPVRPTVRLQLETPERLPSLGLDAVCDFRWEVAMGDGQISPDELQALANAKQPLVQWRGRWVALRPEDLSKAADWLEKRPTAGRAGLVEAMRLQVDAAEWDDAGITPVVTAGWIADVLSGELSERLATVPPPATLHAVLRPYQQRGLDWLTFCDQLNIGACLADDMGLGKTVQLLALLASRRAVGETGTTLLVCPMSVVGNWQREAGRFVPSLRVYVHHGGSRQTGAAFAKRIADTDLVITTYGLVARDLKLLQAVSWERLVMDEAQHVKNPDSRQAKAVVAVPARQRVALTGTPVENRLDELWSIMHVLNPGLLGGRKPFQDRFALPIERERDVATAERLRRLIGPFVLRRLKNDPAIITDLPEKLEMKAFCNLTGEQASLYQAVLDDMLERIEGLDAMARRGLVLATMTKLKQICNHPALFLHDDSALAGRSGKLIQLEDCLTDVLSVGDKALVFTQYAGMGHMLQAHLLAVFGITVPFLYGGTSQKARMAMVDAFQSVDGPPVLLVSLKAGGVGLNLTAATHVIHYDRWWNPAVENQATDRAYRIGQTRTVQVRQFVCLGTLEERIDRMLEDKRDLADRIVGTGEGWLTELSTASLREVLALSADAMMED